jgi:hypothetical protein
MNKKLGYYTVGDRIFYSKVEACMFATKLFNKLDHKLNIKPYQLITWNFNNEAFNNYDWTIEPDSSLDELYDIRSKHLRELYDYIIISFSGGADSWNIIMSFLRQGLFIDEIVVTRMHNAMKNFAIVDPIETSAKYCYEAEFELQTRFRLAEISNLSPKTKITVIDTSNSVFDFFTKNNDESWTLKVREELNPVDASRFDLCKFANVERVLDVNKKIGIIVGMDKAKIRIQKTTNLVELVFTDRTANQIPIGENLTRYTNNTIEYFYWSPDACDLLCKQAHVIKKWLEKNRYYQIFFHESPILLKDNRHATDRILRPILYTTWNKDWFQSDKNQLDWHAENDYWFITQSQNTIEHSLWRSGLDYVKKHCSPYIQYYLNDLSFPDGLIRLKNFYKIGYLYNKEIKITNINTRQNINQKKLIADLTERDLQNLIYVNLK